MDITKKKLRTVSDNRGDIFELLRSDYLNKKQFGHLFCVNFKNGNAVRGNHYHKKATEYYFVIKGKITVILEDVRNKNRKNIELSSENPEVLKIGAYVAHASQALTDDVILIAYNTLPYKDEKPDTFPYKLI